MTIEGIYLQTDHEGALIFLFPESPRWLIDHNQPALGLTTLARLHAHGDEHDPWVRAEFDQIQESITYEHEHEAKSYLELFRNRSSFRRLFLACALQASVQMTGVSAIQYVSLNSIPRFPFPVQFGPRDHSMLKLECCTTLKHEALNKSRSAQHPG